MKMTAYLVTLLGLVHKAKEAEWNQDERIVKMTMNENKQCQDQNQEISSDGRQEYGWKEWEKFKLFVN
jgi:hypothetical protein